MEKATSKMIESKTGFDVTLESIQLLPNLHHEHYHEYVDRQIKEGLNRSKSNQGIDRLKYII